MKKRGEKGGHPDGYNDVCRAGGEKRWGVSEDMKGDLGQTREGEGGEEAAGRMGPVLTAPYSHQRFRSLS